MVLAGAACIFYLVSMANFKTFTNGKYEQRKWVSIGLKPSLVKKLDAVAIAESEKSGRNFSRADLLEQAIQQFLKTYQKENGQGYLLYL